MYYSFNCTYCGRLFYTYAENKEEASKILYKTIKNHLIEYDEDRKEYEMDDGEQADSDQIYYGLTESETPPAGGYEANPDSTLKEEKLEEKSSSDSSHTFFLIIMLLIGIILYLFLTNIKFFMPGIK